MGARRWNTGARCGVPIADCRATQSVCPLVNLFHDVWRLDLRDLALPRVGVLAHGCSTLTRTNSMAVAVPVTVAVTVVTPALVTALKFTVVPSPSV